MTRGVSREGLLGWGRRLVGIALFARLAIPTSAWIESLVSTQFLESSYQQAAATVTTTTAKIEEVEAEDAAKAKSWVDRYNPVDYVTERAQRLYATLADVGESIVNLAIYFTISTIVLPLGTLWLLSKVSGALFASGMPWRENRHRNLLLCRPRRPGGEWRKEPFPAVICRHPENSGRVAKKFANRVLESRFSQRNLSTLSDGRVVRSLREASLRSTEDRASSNKPARVFRCLVLPSCLFWRCS